MNPYARSAPKIGLPGAPVPEPTDFLVCIEAFRQDSELWVAGFFRQHLV